MSYDLSQALANLGYPGFSHFRAGECFLMPEQVVVAMLSSDDVDVRTVEGLPWLLVTMPNLDWNVLTATSVDQGWQNRLGFVAGVAADLSVRMGQPVPAAFLRQQEENLVPFRTEEETTLCRDSMTQVERRWLRDHRTSAARRWHILSGLAPEHLVHVD